jgi:S-adenosylmethionine hydrolase
VVFQTDYGTKDGAVSAMKGVAHGVDAELSLYDITHEIPAYNIWEAAYRLNQSAEYWPAGTVFVSVVDPGVGTERKSVVMKTKTGHYFVTPDNGTLTLVADALGIEAVREIDETINRRTNSQQSYTFHGRDLYAYAAAKLASGEISFEEVGPLLSGSIVRLDYQRPAFLSGLIKGNIPVLDIQYGNVWTNINDSLLKKLNISAGSKVDVLISNGDSVVYQGSVPFVNTFGDVKEGEALGYMNSLMNFSLALNMKSFADSFHIKNGQEWNVTLKKAVQP